jgi:hypothetical protein
MIVFLNIGWIRAEVISIKKQPGGQDVFFNLGRKGGPCRAAHIAVRTTGTAVII